MWSKKPPFGKTTSSDDKKRGVSNTEKQAGKTFRNLPESWVNPFGKMQIFFTIVKERCWLVY